MNIHFDVISNNASTKRHLCAVEISARARLNERLGTDESINMFMDRLINLIVSHGGTIQPRDL